MNRSVLKSDRRMISKCIVLKKMLAIVVSASPAALRFGLSRLETTLSNPRDKTTCAQV
ncbi:MAG TPA: hypothetical protein IGS53_14915 [Leptolyngbyaceae cyanobacterium M33_DOE_097]|nr:hypothetical protein [Leptolyngbyaceae cyanobacterium M33_DOE_097]